MSIPTTGPDQPASFTVTLDGGSSRTVEAGGTTTFDTVSATAHTVALDGVPSNCSVAGTNPRSITVSAGQTVSVSFEVTCEPLTGAIEVTATTVGEEIDVDGYTVDLARVTTRPIDANGTITVSDVPTGTHSLELVDVARIAP